jgi:hypothetical protein
VPAVPASPSVIGAGALLGGGLKLGGMLAGKISDRLGLESLGLGLGLGGLAQSLPSQQAVAHGRGASSSLTAPWRRGSPGARRRANNRDSAERYVEELRRLEGSLGALLRSQVFRALAAALLERSLAQVCHVVLRCVTLCYVVF